MPVGLFVHKKIKRLDISLSFQDIVTKITRNLLIDLYHRLAEMTFKIIHWKCLLRQLFTGGAVDPWSFLILF